MSTQVYQGSGLVVQWTNNNNGDLSSGAMCTLGTAGLSGHLLEDIAEGSTGSVLLPPGVIIKHNVKGHDGSSNAAVAQYDKVYFTSGESFMDVDSNQVQAGYAMTAVGSGETTEVPVLLDRA